MKKGFTMIELIFVIVILGILAAVAIPRLAATRDDAEMSKAAANLATITKDLAGYYTSQGNFSPALGDMTNVILVDNKGVDNNNTSKEMYLQVKKALCFEIELGSEDNGTWTKAADADAVKNEADAIRIKAVAMGNGKKICKEVNGLPAIQSIMTNKALKENDTKVYNVGGTGVVYDVIEGLN